MRIRLSFELLLSLLADESTGGYHERNGDDLSRVKTRNQPGYLSECGPKMRLGSDSFRYYRWDFCVFAASAAIAVSEGA